MDLPAVVRSTHTWDTEPGRDLRKGEEAIVVDAREGYEEHGQGNLVFSTIRLIPIDRPRLIVLRSQSSLRSVFKRWLPPA